MVCHFLRNRSMRSLVNGAIIHLSQSALLLQQTSVSYYKGYVSVPKKEGTA
jgi:hypothetical protein